MAFHAISTEFRSNCPPIEGGRSGRDTSADPAANNLPATTRRADGCWIDTAWDGEAETEVVEAFSEAYFALLKKGPEVAKMLAVGNHVIVVLDGQVLEIRPAKSN